MVPFAGFSMPVQYSGIRQEHEAVRKQAGLFDVSHMGNFLVSGKAALAFLQKVTVNNVAKLGIMEAQYSALCYSNGSVVDDILVYRLAENEFHLVVNAANIQKDFSWLQSHLQGDVELVDSSEGLGIISLQGPKAVEIANSLTETDLGLMKYYGCALTRIAGMEMLVSRTGYTGEDGFEFFPKNVEAPMLWNRILEAGSGYGIVPVGLGARDTLRLEAGYSLYGHEISDQINLIEAGLAWIIDFAKGDFIGREALLNESNKRTDPEAKECRTLIGLEMTDKAIPRDGYKVFAEGREIGTITSGTMSPSYSKGIALALVERIFADKGTKVDVSIRDVLKPAKVTSRFFYRRPKNG